MDVTDGKIHLMTIIQIGNEKNVTNNKIFSIMQNISKQTRDISGNSSGEKLLMFVHFVNTQNSRRYLFALPISLYF